MKKISLFTAGLLFSQLAYNQCDTTQISNAGWSVVSFDSEEPTGEGSTNGHAIHCIDGNLTTYWHTQWQAAQDSFPHDIIINLGASYALNGFDLVTRASNAFGKADEILISTSTDGSTWTDQVGGHVTYPLGANSGTQQTVQFRFGAVTAQYVHFQALTSATNNYYLATAEINMYQDLGCGASGLNNQILSLDAVPQKFATDAPFNLNATINTALPITYTVVSGPATIAGNQVTLTGVGGTVVVKASQAGNASYYPVEATTSFNVVDLATITPVVTSKLTDAVALEMPQLYAYKLYAYASIDQDSVLSISSMEFEIDGTNYPADSANGAYFYWWTPSSFGMHVVKIRATASNGQVTENTLNVNVTQTFADQTVSTFNGDVINFDGTGASQWFYGTYVLPQFVGAYDSIQAKFSVSCPSVTGGCDDWDRVGRVEYLAPDGDWHELFRYITPYGVACNHSIDVTDFASELQGNIQIRMYIETWGTGGWKLDLDLSYYKGTPEYLYSSVEEVWQGTFNFGNMTTPQPVPTKNITFPANTVQSKLRLNTTGHGWGSNNTDNAAEFYHATHQIQVNGTNTFTQDLWTQCNPNPDGCTGQAGTWQYDRAGWCPGTIAKPYKFDLAPYIAQGNIDFDYQFQPSYIDLCNASNPGCISGTTCTDCNDGYNPNYVVSAYVISQSNQILGIAEHHLEKDQGMDLVLYPNPSEGNFKLTLNALDQAYTVNVIGIDGAIKKTYFFQHIDQLNAYTFNINSLEAGLYFVKVNTEHSSVFQRVVKK